MLYKPTLTIVHLKSKKVPSISHLHLQFTQNRIPQRFSLKKQIKTSDWKPTVKGFTKDRDLNYWLRQIIQKGEKIIGKYEEMDKFLSFSVFKEEYRKTFFSYTKGESDLYSVWKKMDDRDFMMETITETTYKQRRSHLRIWQKFKSKLVFHQITNNVIDSFVFFRKNQGVKNTTISTDLRKISSVFSYAISQSIINQPNPFPDYISKFTKGNSQSSHKKENLTFGERDKLRIWYNENKDTFNKPKQRERVRLFIVMCYTGMAYSDIQKVTFRDIRELKYKGYNWYIFYDERQKTNSLFKVVIHPLIKDIVYESYTEGNTKSSDKIFMKLDLSYFNRSIGGLLKPVGIERKVTTHVGRHTFAMLSLEEGVQKDTVQNMMGHSDGKQTDIYAHRTMQGMVADVAKFWGEPINRKEYNKADLSQERQIIKNIIQHRKALGLSVEDFYNKYSPANPAISTIEKSINDKTTEAPLLSILDVAGIARNLVIPMVDLITGKSE